MSPRRSPREHLTAAAEACAAAMGHRFVDGTPSGPGATGAWFIDRQADERGRARYLLVERCADGSVRCPLWTVALPARELALALDFARLATGIERTGAAAHELGYPYRGDRPGES